jgi:predicted acyltransferase
MTAIPFKRLYSLDALRGFDMFWIMGGDAMMRTIAEVTEAPFMDAVAKQFDHPAWHGFALYDLIFPLFLFLSGVATPYSVGRQLEKGNSKTELLGRVVKRGLILVFLGILTNTRGFQLMPLHEIRFGSVLGRIGLAYMFANIIYLYAGRRMQILWCTGLLIGYWLLLKFTSAPGFPAGDLTMEGNFASYLDRLIMPGELYLKVHDPEGFASTIPAIGTALLGIFAGELLKNGKQPETKKAMLLLGAGVVAIILAQLWNLDFPINKNLWTSSFVLHAGGISLILLAVFYYIIDILNYREWAFFFVVIGMNSILIYMSGVFINWRYTTEAFFKWAVQLAGEHYGIVVMVLCMILVKWVFLYFLYKKNVFLRV